MLGDYWCGVTATISRQTWRVEISRVAARQWDHTHGETDTPRTRHLCLSTRCRADARTAEVTGVSTEQIRWRQLLSERTGHSLYTRAMFVIESWLTCGAAVRPQTAKSYCNELASLPTPWYQLMRLTSLSEPTTADSCPCTPTVLCRRSLIPAN